MRFYLKLQNILAVFCVMFVVFIASLFIHWIHNVTDCCPCEQVSRSKGHNDPNSTLLYIITPTYRRQAQLPDMVRMAQTLMHLDYIRWIVVEDGTDTNQQVDALLNRSGIAYKYFAAPKRNDLTRGAFQRNAALRWIRRNKARGVMYFADDDNTYDLRLFPELLKVKNIGMLPTGNIQETGVSSPVVENGKVVGFFDCCVGMRTYPVDMASIVINIDYWRKRKEPMFVSVIPGFLENQFLRALDLHMVEIEPLAEGCTKVYVWHTQTQRLDPIHNVHHNIEKYKNTNIEKLIMDNVVVE